MKKYVLGMALAFLSFKNYGQSNVNEVKIGDEVTLSEPAGGDTYKHINFPKKNIIIKRGAIADFNSLSGLPLEVTSIKNTATDDKIVTLKRRDGKKFFRFYKTVDANFSDAIKSKELISK